jgi:hypothetical protein
VSVPNGRKSIESIESDLHFGLRRRKRARRRKKPSPSALVCRGKTH